MIAALFVEQNGPYANLENVDAWPAYRDARKYPGPYPVVAHPPCTRWCRLAGLVQKRYGYKKGDDGGCFAFALEAVRTFGGILEHPAFSAAWLAFGLTEPLPNIWTRCIDGGWIVEVRQLDFGHPAEKRTWLYAFGVKHLPMIPRTEAIRTAHCSRTWTKAVQPTARTSFLRNRDKVPSTLRRLSSKEASRTPVAFRDWLLSIAESASTHPPNPTTDPA